MKKHQVLKIKADIYSEIASYVDDMTTRYNEEIENYAKKVIESPEDEYYKERVEEYKQRAEITSSLYIKILKEF